MQTRTNPTDETTPMLMPLIVCSSSMANSIQSVGVVTVRIFVLVKRAHDHAHQPISVSSRTPTPTPRARTI